MNNNILYCCFSVPLRDYLLKNGQRYELCGLNPKTLKMFWVFIKTEKLKELLANWGH